MITGINRFIKGKFNQDALDEVYSKGKDLYVAEVTPPSSGILPNSVELIWADTYAPNLNFTTATSTSQGQYDTGDPYKPPFEIGTTGYPVPTVNTWNEVELEGTDTSCSHSINQAVNTRVEIAGYEGWWKDASGNWQTMNTNSRGGGILPAKSGLTSGERGCTQQYFKDIRDPVYEEVKADIVTPGVSFDTRSNLTHIFVKPQSYFRWHGWGARTTFETPQTCKGIVTQQYFRLVVDDPNGPDDRHLARFVVHTACDRKDYDGTQMWNIEISRFKRVTNDWQPFSTSHGIMSFEELQANPPPFQSRPL